MAQINSQILKSARSFVNAVEKEGIHLDAAYLFGSYAKGNARPESDIDIALISPDFSEWVDDYAKIRGALLAKDPRIEHVRIRPEHFVDENPLVYEIKTTGVSLLAPPKSRAPRKPRANSKRKRRVAA